MRRIIELVGRTIIEGTLGAGYTLRLLYLASRRLFNPRHPGREFRAMVVQMFDHGVKAIPVVTLVAVFTGMILSLQTGLEIRDFGAEDTVGQIVSASLFREMGPLITAIILTATSGAACAAEIGTMRVSEEIDALEMMSIDPVRFLVLPRIMALGFMCFLLTILTDVAGVLGGALVAHTNLGVSYGVYMKGARETLADEFMFGYLSKHVYSGLFKAYVFGILIGTVGCAQGLLASGGALGVGRAVRRAVVISIVLILVLGYYMTWGFYSV
ncbi:MAG: MlaE family ABC transporter permease [Planctomycetota bacterium]|jgi:phospholipid/cholesterol/gamma-HCH transport system permease protein